MIVSLFKILTSIWKTLSFPILGERCVDFIPPVVIIWSNLRIKAWKYKGSISRLKKSVSLSSF